MRRFFKAGHKPHASIVIDIYKKTCAESLDNTVIVGMEGCKSCIVETLAEAMIRDEQLALIIRESVIRAADLTGLNKY